MKLRITISFLVLILLLLSIPSFAGQKGNEYIVFFGFTLNKGTLSDIQNKLGNAKLIEKGDAGEYEASICYLLPSGHRITFLSGELGGSSHEFLGYSVRKTSEVEDDCLRINSLDSKRFKPEVGKLRLGMTKKEFTQAFGKKINWIEENRAIISFESRRKMTTQELHDFENHYSAASEYPYFDIVVSLIGAFNKDILNEFTVWKTETN